MAQVNRKRKLEATFTRRRRLLVAVALCVWGAIWARAVQLQVVNGSELTDRSVRQSDRRVRLVAPRGDIVDRQGRLLAINIASESFFAYPNRESSVRTLASKFAPILSTSRSRLSSQWKKRDDRFTWLIRRCDAQTAQRIRSWNLPGVHPTGEYTRVYPCVIPGVNDPIGFVNDALEGAAGLELAYSQCLTGLDGEGVLVADATGRQFDLDPVPVKPLHPGTDLELSLDWGWQSILAEETVAAVEKWKARSGMALLMNPHTGEILAMVDYNPANPGRRVVKNRLVSDVIEPGSTFKIVTFAGALSDGVISLYNHFDGEGGKAKFSGRTLHDDKKHGIMSAGEVFVVSSNIGTGRIANLMEPGRLDFWARRLGFCERTGIDLSGESPGQLAQQPYSEFNVATLAIGHGIAVTPLQIAAAYATVANGGYLVRPHLVTKMEHADGTVVRTETKGERVLRPEVAHILQGLMARVVSEGTATQIWDPKFPIAGKTGTAEKPDPRTGGYDKTKYIASFVGFYPASRPRILGLVILDEPQGIHYGGYTAAPVLLNTIRRGTGPEADGLALESRPDAPLVELVKMDERDWARRLASAVAPIVSVAEARAARDDGQTSVSTEQQGEPCAKTAWASLDSDRGPANITPASGWPDLRGLNLRDAVASLRAMDVKWEIDGAGLVVNQSPAPTSTIAENQICRLTLQ